MRSLSCACTRSCTAVRSYRIKYVCSYALMYVCVLVQGYERHCARMRLCACMQPDLHERRAQTVESRRWHRPAASVQCYTTDDAHTCVVPTVDTSAGRDASRRRATDYIRNLSKQVRDRYRLSVCTVLLAIEILDHNLEAIPRYHQ